MKISRTVRLLGIIILPSSRSTAWFADGIQNLNQRWKVCIDVGGEYFEKEMKEFFKNIYIYTVQPCYLGLAYFESPLISK